MPISSLIVRAAPEMAKQVADHIRRLSGADVSRIQGDSIVAVTETETREQDKKLWDDMKAIDGVLGVDLIYHNFEDMEHGSHEEN